MPNTQYTHANRINQKTLSVPRKKTMAIGRYIIPCKRAITDTSFFLVFSLHRRVCVYNWTTEPNNRGSEVRRPSSILLAIRNTAYAGKKDSPNPIIEAANEPSSTEYFRLFLMRSFSYIVFMNSI